jgi:hypothetical protein
MSATATEMTTTEMTTAEMTATGMAAARTATAVTEPGTSAVAPPTTVEKAEAVIGVDVSWGAVKIRERKTSIILIVIVPIGA